MLWPRQGLGDARVEKHASSHLIQKLWLKEYPIPLEGRVNVFSREAGGIRLSTKAEQQETSDKDMDPLDSGGISCETEVAIKIIL